MATGYLARSQRQEVSIGEQVVMSFAGLIAYLVMHGFTLASRGQSLGKIMTNIAGRR